MVSEDMTIAQAKAILRKNVNKGFTCPCCTRFAKVYKRSLTAAMCVGLIKIYKATVNVPAAQWIHLEDFFKSFPDLPSSIRGDVPKLRFWNLIERKPGEKEDGNPCNGYYRITHAGMNFVELRGTVPSHARIYDNKLLNFPEDAKWINISEALRNKFDYLKLMNS